MKALHTVTPLLESSPLSKHLGATVLLKMDSMQPSGSFKIRGIGRRCMAAVEGGDKCSHFISSSGGNAGVAVAYSGRKLGVKTTVVIPQSTPQFMKEKMEAEGATVIVHGSVWDDADKLARSLCASDPQATYIHPFDHPEVWNGHSTIITEVHQQMQEMFADNARPDVIVTVVGGGGLLCGVLQGLQQVEGWHDVPVIAVETEGAASFYSAMQKGELVTLPAITTIAKTLGAKTVCQAVLDKALAHGHVKTVTVPDAWAAESCLRFADDGRSLVEAACGAALSAVYRKIEPLENILNSVPAPRTAAKVVVIVCGGNMISQNLLQEWKDTFLLKDPKEEVL